MTDIDKHGATDFVLSSEHLSGELSLQVQSLRKE